LPDDPHLFFTIFNSTIAKEFWQWQRCMRSADLFVLVRTRDANAQDWIEKEEKMMAAIRSRALEAGCGLG